MKSFSLPFFMLLFILFANLQPAVSQQKVFVNNAQFNYGLSLAVSGDGNTVLVSSLSINGLNGGAFVYTKGRDSFVQTATLIPSSVSNLDNHPSLSVSGNGKTAVLGFWDNRYYNNKFYSGIAFVFSLTDEGWTQTAVLLPSAKNSNQALTYYGLSVSISEDGGTIAVGAPLQPVKDSDEGIVYLYRLINNVWTEQNILHPADNLSAEFGYSVSLSQNGQQVAIGDPDYNYKQGRAFVYEQVNNQWLEKRLQIDNQQAKGKLGYSVSLSADGKTAIAGAPDETATNQYEGAVYTFRRAGANWLNDSRIAQANAFPEDHFGYATSLSDNGNTAALGCAVGQNDPPRFRSATGKAFVYRRNNQGWNVYAKLLPADIKKGDAFGWAIAISGNATSLAVSAPYATINYYLQGCAYLYTSAINHLADKNNLLSKDATETIKVYPNPATTLLHIDGLNTVSAIKLTLADVSGNVMGIHKAHGNYTWDIAQLKSGHYLLNISLPDGTTIVKHVVKK